MPSAAPLEPGIVYHVFNCGNNREDLFSEDRNFEYFLRLYTKHVAPSVDTLAYCLMRNHFHLLIRPKNDGADGGTRASRGLTSLFAAYAMAFNKANNRTGKLFQEHFGRIAVTTEHYFTNLVFYIHFNPQKHGFVGDFRQWRWSSYHALCTTATTQLSRDEVIRWFGGTTLFKQFHQGVLDERTCANAIGEP
jgi:REP element-mobilizing transposase RayT